MLSYLPSNSEFFNNAKFVCAFDLRRLTGLVSKYWVEVNDGCNNKALGDEDLIPMATPGFNNPIANVVDMLNTINTNISENDDCVILLVVLEESPILANDNCFIGGDGYSF